MYQAPVSVCTRKQLQIRHRASNQKPRCAAGNEMLTSRTPLSSKPITLHAAFPPPFLSRGQTGGSYREPHFLLSYSSGILSPDQRGCATYKLHPTMSRGRGSCRCCCCCCYCCCFCCWCSRESQVKILFRDQRDGSILPFCRRFLLPFCRQRTQLLTRAS